MANISGGTVRGINFNDLEIGGLLDYANATVSSTTATYFDDGNNYVRFTGTGLTFNSNKEPTGGTVAAVLLVTEGATVLQLTGLNVAATTIFSYAKTNDTVGFFSLIFAGNDTLTGTALRDIVATFAGNDKLSGRGGADKLDGGGGNDTIQGGPGADALIGGTGKDTASYVGAAAGVSVYLATPASNTGEAAGDTFASIENLLGSGKADRLLGDGGANALTGGAGNDTLNGLGGNDTLVGNGGKDRLIGGLGTDTLSGGAADDTFVFNALSESVVTASARDRITDFTHASDRIDLSAIDAIAGGADDAFAFRGTAGFTGIGQVRVIQSGSDAVVAVNTSAAAGPEMTILLLDVTASVLTAGDFIL